MIDKILGNRLFVLIAVFAISYPIVLLYEYVYKAPMSFILIFINTFIVHVMLMFLKYYRKIN